ncbi:MAG TPA: Eco57I restriction-modification methylase domain-containing protein, partial [bacterium]|nr:Eco57I restriction-modification methylase domain-containing protein [bacterium]
DVTDEDKQITIENFAELIDDKSWEEFMPKGVSKEVFESFKKYYEPDVFRAAGKRIRAMARAADNLTIEERIERISNIFGTFRNPDKETVLTPWRVVNMHMGDCLGGYVFFDEIFEKTLEIPRYVDQGEVTKEVFDKDSKILEINSKSGLYPLYMTYGIYKNIIAESSLGEEPLAIEDQLKIWDKVVAENIFVICKTPMAKSITKRTLVGFRNAKVNTRYFEDLVNQIINKQQNFIDKVKQGENYWKATNGENNMKFNAIVGNPPYMEMDGGASASARPIYNYFVEISKLIRPEYISMIMPSRWYSGGKGLDEFRDKMLSDKHISVLHDFLNPEEVFPKTNIRGGICYFLWSSNYDNTTELTQVITHQAGSAPKSIHRLLKTGNNDTFIRHEIAVGIIEKINKRGTFHSIEKHVSSRKPFGLEGFIVNLEKFRPSKKGLKNPVLCYGKGKKIGFMEKREIAVNQTWIDKYKVFVPYANNIGTELNDDNLNTFVGEPGTICTETYIIIGVELELDKYKAKNITKYFSTKFLRFLHSLAKASQHATAKTYKLVPLQDFSSNSDIDWSKSIPEIDRQLYSKYELTEGEINFIESMIKPME